MIEISRRRLITGAFTALGIAAFRPTGLTDAQLWLGNLFRGKGHETPPITPNDDFYVTSYDLTPPVELRDLVSWPYPRDYVPIQHRSRTRTHCKNSRDIDDRDFSQTIDHWRFYSPWHCGISIYTTSRCTTMVREFISWQRT